MAAILGQQLESEDVDTLGGAILAALGAIPEQGQEVRLQGIDFRVEKVSGYAVSLVSVELPPGAAVNLPPHVELSPAGDGQPGNGS